MKKINFCTLFDINYITRGLALYESLIQNCPDSHIYMFPFDEKTNQILKSLNLEKATIISLNEFEDEELLNVKKTRTNVEYCWTCTPSIISYCLENFFIDSCTYVDADLYFFSNPKKLIDEMQEKSVSLIEHRFLKGFEQLQNGIYCVQFMTFKNNLDGRKILKWWRDACIDWCYSTSENGKFGDQKYLDDWPERFPGQIHVIPQHGAGVAPWNDLRYKFYVHENKIMIKNKEDNTIDELVFYHFHNIKNNIKSDSISIVNYMPKSDLYRLIFKKYFLELENARQRIYLNSEIFDIHKKPYDFKVKKIKMYLKLFIMLYKYHKSLYKS